jgi:murein DD-endopeptidase MepM/ murein hydrolase activator NlpD
MTDRVSRKQKVMGRRAWVLAAVLAVVATGCGQIGGVHQRPLPPGTELTASTGTTSATGVADTGIPTNTGDTGGASGPSFGIDPTQLSGESSSGGQIVTHTTVTTTLPQLQPINVLTNTNGPLYACPVQGYFQVGDSFGAARYAGGYHPHAGNDMFADEGTPIVAPFDGYAYADPNTLGGNAVIVKGVDGYVYNAHLSAYGRLGQVHTGDVIGYVGNTGDAQGTAFHDHFEWHPYHPTISWVGPYGLSVIDSGDPPAVDPFPYLEAACK